MSNNEKERELLYPQQEVKWALCHPEVLSLAVGTVLVWRRLSDQQTGIDRRVETEADIIEGDVPLFI